MKDLGNTLELYKSKVDSALQNELRRGGSCMYHDGEITLRILGGGSSNYEVHTMYSPAVTGASKDVAIKHVASSLETCLELAMDWVDGVIASQHSRVGEDVWGYPSPDQQNFNNFV